MAAKSNSTTTRRKSKAVSSPKAIHLTPELRYQKARSKAIKEICDFIDNATEAEMKVVGHLNVFNYSPERLMKETRRLLGESIAKCKVIPFPSIKKLGGS